MPTRPRLTDAQAAALKVLEKYGPVEARRRLARSEQPPLLDDHPMEHLDFIADLRKLARGATGFAELCYAHQVDNTEWQAFRETLVAMLDQVDTYQATEFGHPVVDAENPADPDSGGRPGE